MYVGHIVLHLAIAPCLQPSEGNSTWLLNSQTSSAVAQCQAIYCVALTFAPSLSTFRAAGVHIPVRMQGECSQKMLSSACPVGFGTGTIFCQVPASMSLMHAAATTATNKHKCCSKETASNWATW
jgi:hypothetical protein